MCGIVGYIGKKNAIEILINGLEKLEYRGYDSAGIAFLTDDIKILKNKGKIKNLKNKINFDEKSTLGIGHTRWATHGEANEINAHPHQVGKITLVHNGIIENYEEIKKELINKGYTFKTETDSEVGCALLNFLYQKNQNMIKSIEEFKTIVKGSYALGIICSDDKDTLYTVKNASPLIIGVGDNENFIASDVPAILKYTNKYITLDDLEFAKITKDKIECYDKKNKVITKDIKIFSGDAMDIEKNGYEHFMLKEIHEEPSVIKKTFDKYIDNNKIGDKIPDLSKYKKITIVACGSAYHAGLIGKNLIENYANIPVDVEIASEYRYKKHFFNEKDLVIVVSQSGETADTLASLKLAKENKIDTLGIINVKESSIARESDIVLYTEAGNEIAVATTKAYSTQVALFSLISLTIANKNNLLNKDEIIEILKEIKLLPNKIEQLINNDIYQKIAEEIYKDDDIFFLGRGIDYAIALEGSLKLKEISYIHSEAYAAGELKHGTISLIDKDTPVIAIITDNSIKDKTISNVKEVKARGAKTILISNENLDNSCFDKKVIIPSIHPLLQPLLTVIPLQLIAYEVAKLRDCDIDKPKNLAKSVTVE
mgnify:FL=1